MTPTGCRGTQASCSRGSLSSRRPVYGSSTVRETGKATGSSQSSCRRWLSSKKPRRVQSQIAANESSGSQMSPYHWHRIVPLRQLVAPLEVVNDLRAVWAAQLHKTALATLLSKIVLMIPPLLHARECARTYVIRTTDWKSIMIAVPRSYTFAIKIAAITTRFTCTTSRNGRQRSRYKVVSAANKNNYYHCSCRIQFVHNYFLLLSAPNNCVSAPDRELSTDDSR
jgi:hypothetical protein